VIKRLLKNSRLSADRRPAQRDDYAMAPSPIIMLTHNYTLPSSKALLCGCNDLTIFERPEFFNSLLKVGGTMNIRKKFLDYEYEEVLDGRTRELIRVGCAIAVGCPT